MNNVSSKSAIETLVAAWNSGDINRIAACYADNTRVVHPMAGTLDGRAAVKAFESGMFDAFSELDWKAVKVIERGDEVALEFCVKALNSKPMATPKGQLPATNKRIVVNGCSVLKLSPKGVIVEEHRYLDTGSLFMQLGLA